jgi:hypothetical protein
MQEAHSGLLGAVSSFRSRISAQHLLSLLQIKIHVCAVSMCGRYMDLTFYTSRADNISSLSQSLVNIVWFPAQFCITIPLKVSGTLGVQKIFYTQHIHNELIFKETWVFFLVYQHNQSNNKKCKEFYMHNFFWEAL